MSSLSEERKELLERLSYELGRELSAQTVMFHSAVAEKLGLSVTEHKALDLLGRGGPMTAGQFAEVTGLTTGAITGMVDRLERAGFVKRSADPSDRRKVVIEPIEDKYEEVGWMFASLGQAMRRLLEPYSEEELTIIYSFVSQVPALMREQTQKLKES